MVDQFLSQFYCQENRTPPVWQISDCEVIFLRLKRNDVIYLEQIIASVPGQGFGTRAMALICEAADLCCVNLWLEAKPLNQSHTEEWLVEWYKQFGFKVMPIPQKIELGGLTDMYRPFSTK